MTLRHCLVPMLLSALVGCAVDGSTTAEEEVAKELPERAEVKVLLAEAAFDPASLGARPSTRTITFYDTPRLELSKAGLLLRSRDGEDGDDDITVKLRPFVPSQVVRSLQGEAELKCELDVNAGSQGTSSCSWTESVDGSRIKRAARDPRAIAALWTSKAERFAAQRGHAITTLDVRPFGPISSTVWKLEAEDLAEEITFERWDVPGGNTTLEASVKVKTANVRAKETALLAWLDAHRLTQAKVQQTKTAAALEALARPVR